MSGWSSAESRLRHLFAPFPEEMIDAAFFDRMHCYLPGGEVPYQTVSFL